MPLTLKTAASEIMMCGLKKVPVAGAAFEVIDAIKSRHEHTLHGDRLTGVAEKRTRVEERMRNVVVEEMRSILETLRKPDLSGPAWTEEIRNFRQIQEQGRHPSLAAVGATLPSASVRRARGGSTPTGTNSRLGLRLARVPFGT